MGKCDHELRYYRYRSRYGPFQELGNEVRW